MTDHYPGSKQPVKQYPAKLPRVIPSAPEELGEPFRYYRVLDKVTGMYTVGQLARALGRKSVTIRRWETLGTIPVAPFIAPSEVKEGQRRLYSHAHVLGMIQIAEEEGVLQDLAKKITETKFQERVLALFEDLKDGG